MTYETFLEIVTLIQDNDRTHHKLWELNVNLIEFVDPYEKLVSILLTEIYGKEGYDWFSWFCYENDFGQKGVGAWDADGNPICVDIKSTWEYLETNYNNYNKRK